MRPFSQSELAKMPEEEERAFRAKKTKQKIFYVNVQALLADKVEAKREKLQMGQDLMAPRQRVVQLLAGHGGREWGWR